MSTALWDPANLLQISYEIQFPGAPIICVGEAKTRHGNRCRWDIPSPDNSKVRSILTQLSATDPEVVDRQTLLSLAYLCLCEKYHKSQATEVADRWVGIVSRAAEQRSRQPPSADSSSASKSSTSDSSPGLLLELKKAQDEAKEASEKYKKLEGNLAIKTEELTRYKLKAQQEIWVTSQRDQASRAEVASIQEEKDRLKEETEMLRDKLQEATLKGRRHETSTYHLKREKLVLNEQLDTLRKKLLVATERTQQLETDFSRANEEVADLRSKTAGLGEENSVILAAIRQMEAERDVARDSHKQATVELAEKKRSIVALQNEVHSLQLAKASLQQSIAACWLHRLWAWIAPFCMTRGSDGFKCGK